MAKVIAIDPGYTNLGYAVGYNRGLIDFGTLYFKDKDRLKEIYVKISDLFRKHKPTKALVEDYRVYNETNRGKHKTAFAIGVIVACAYEQGVSVELIPYKTWQARFKRVYSVAWARLPPEWKDGLQNGSEHSRDAVMMLLPEVVSLKALLVGGKR